MRLSKIPVATSTAGRPEGLSVFELSTDIFGADGCTGVSAYRRTRSRHKGGVQGVQGFAGEPLRIVHPQTRKYLLFWRDLTGNRGEAGGSRELRSMSQLYRFRGHSVICKERSHQ